VALAATASALLMRWALTPWVGGQRPYLTLFAAVAFAVWFVRWRPATVAAVVGFLGANYFFVMSREALVLDGTFWADLIENMRAARSRFPGVRFLVLSSDDDPVQIDRAMAAGASGFAVKDGNFDALAAAIHKVAAGETVQPGGGMRNRNDMTPQAEIRRADPRRVAADDDATRGSCTHWP
jgi:hypothetical protein